jgi:hypothetical protein
MGRFGKNLRAALIGASSFALAALGACSSAPQNYSDSTQTKSSNSLPITPIAARTTSVMTAEQIAAQIPQSILDNPASASYPDSVASNLARRKIREAVDRVSEELKKFDSPGDEEQKLENEFFNLNDLSQKLIKASESGARSRNSNPTPGWGEDFTPPPECNNVGELTRKSLQASHRALEIFDKNQKDPHNDAFQAAERTSETAKNVADAASARCSQALHHQ